MPIKGSLASPLLQSHEPGALPASPYVCATLPTILRPGSGAITTLPCLPKDLISQGNQQQQGTESPIRSGLSKCLLMFPGRLPGLIFPSSMSLQHPFLDRGSANYPYSQVLALKEVKRMSLEKKNLILHPRLKPRFSLT